MTSVLIIQKDTLENEKVKAVLTVCEEDPNQFTSNLQEGHCIPYQLIAHTPNNSEMVERLSIISTPFKTNHGKNWYEFNHQTIAEIISLFVEYNNTWINIQSISDIMGFNFTMYPVVTKEITISNIPSVPIRIHNTDHLKIDPVPLEKKDEIIDQILKLEKSSVRDKRRKEKRIDRPRDKSERHDRVEKSERFEKSEHRRKDKN